MRVIGLEACGLEVCEVRVAAEDLTGPMAVTEIVARPDLESYCNLSPEMAQRIGSSIIELLFPNNQPSRIPIASVTGTNGKTTTTRLIAHIVALTGKRVGMTCTDGIYISGTRIDHEDCSGPRSARNVLMNPLVDAAVLETARGGMLREGLAFDRSDVSVVMNIGEGDHLGLNYITTVEDLAVLKRVIVQNVAASGMAVLNAADPIVAAMAANCPGQVTFFAFDSHHPVMATHRAQGKRVLFVRDGDGCRLVQSAHCTDVVAVVDAVHRAAEVSAHGPSIRPRAPWLAPLPDLMRSLPPHWAVDDDTGPLDLTLPTVAPPIV